MTFGLVLTIIIVGYILFYGGMIINDLFFSKQGVVENATVDEEEIDISDEARNFQPIHVGEEPENENENDDNNGQDETSMNGGVEIDELLQQADDMALNGDNSELAKLCSCWSFT